MKLLIQHKISNELQFTCKTCGKEYKVNYDDLSTVPVWKFESCSKLCAMSCSDNKFLTLNKKVLS